MTHPDNLRRLEGSGPWLHPSSPKVQASRARDAARIARVVLLSALAIGIAVFLTQKVFPAVAWEVQNATIERY